MLGPHHTGTYFGRRGIVNAEKPKERGRLSVVLLPEAASKRTRPLRHGRGDIAHLHYLLRRTGDAPRSEKTADAYDKS